MTAVSLEIPVEYRMRRDGKGMEENAAVRETLSKRADVFGSAWITAAIGWKIERLPHRIALLTTPPIYFTSSPPRLTTTQLARSSVLNRLIAPTGLSPPLRRASRAHRDYSPDTNGTKIRMFGMGVVDGHKVGTGRFATGLSEGTRGAASLPRCFAAPDFSGASAR
jgi:hypothetical protein